MDKRALIIYLDELRHLESIRYSIKEAFSSLDIQTHKEAYELSRMEKEGYRTESMPKEPVSAGKPGCLTIGVGLFLIFGVTTAFSSKLIAQGLIGLIALAILVAIPIIKRKCSYNEYYSLCHKISCENDSRKRTYEKGLKTAKDSLALLKRKNATRKTEYTQELNEIDKILYRFYSIPIIPKQYWGNLAAIEYMYDMATTTALSYNDIILHAHMEDGIKRLENKLDNITNKLNSMLYDMRAIKSNQYSQNNMLEQNLRNNIGVLNELKRIERNTDNASNYAQIAACCEATNAYYTKETFERLRYNGVI